MALMGGSPILTDERFGRAARDGRSTGVLTVQGTVTATGVLLVLMVASATAGWLSVPELPVRFDEFGRQLDAGVGDIPAWVWGAGVVGLVFALVTIFKPRAARVTAPLYALSYGVVVGAISHVYDASYDGVVTQALFATFSIFTVMLALYATRIIRVTNRFVLVVVGATLGIFVMYLASFVASLFGANVGFLHDGSPLAIGISLFIIVIAALNLAIDFAYIESAARHGAPKFLEWYAAFGVVITLVWIYLEVLRLLGMLNRRD